MWHAGVLNHKIKGGLLGMDHPRECKSRGSPTETAAVIWVAQFDQHCRIIHLSADLSHSKHTTCFHSKSGRSDALGVREDICVAATTKNMIIVWGSCLYGAGYEGLLQHFRSSPGDDGTGAHENVHLRIALV